MRWRSLVFVAGVAASLCAVTSMAAVIRVPADQQTIQGAINEAASGDTVLVAPGDYPESLFVSNKGVKLISMSGPEVTAFYTITINNSNGTTIDGFELASAGGYSVLWTGAIASCTMTRCLMHSGIRAIAFGNLEITKTRILHVEDANIIHTETGLAVRFINNTVDGGGQGLAIYGANSVIMNNIVANLNSYGIWTISPSSVLDYNDFWNNHPSYGNNQQPGSHDIQENPLWVNADSADYSLSEQSPCIDTGNPAPQYNDPDGSRNDIGAIPLICHIGVDTADCDSDGVPNVSDNCRQIPNQDQSDQDLDGVGDVCDNCPMVFNSDQTNSDSDNNGDACDHCPTLTSLNHSDSDDDGIGDVCDGCPLDSLNDADGDGLCGNVDNCALTPNYTQVDTDGDGLGDACDSCTDTDGDGFGNPGYLVNECPADNCPLIANVSQADSDGDGVGDGCDNCENVANPSQSNPDGDLLGDACDNCPSMHNQDQADNDSDGVGDACDNCPSVHNPNQADNNGNNIGDACDCNCFCHGDPVCDSVRSEIRDVVITINVAFRGSTPIVDPSVACAYKTTDFNCSGATDVVDVLKSINVAFRGANSETEYCVPCN